jgi:hypothetical protein
MLVHKYKRVVVVHLSILAMTRVPGVDLLVMAEMLLEVRVFPDGP